MKKQAKCPHCGNSIDLKLNVSVIKNDERKNKLKKKKFCEVLLSLFDEKETVSKTEIATRTRFIGKEERAIWLDELVELGRITPGAKAKADKEGVRPYSTYTRNW